MKISYDWLKDFIDIDLKPEELAEKLVSLGIEVSDISSTGAGFSGVLTAQIKKICKHPNADKLSLAEVDYGSGTTTVVCGASNIKEGQKVPLALVGAKLPGGILKQAKIRSVVSEGMICSAPELNMDGSADGILILAGDTPIGKDFAEMQGKSDTVLELEITPNRGDLLSHLGIARELAVLLNIELKKPVVKTFETKEKCIPIKINAPGGCPRYLGRVIKNVSLKQSPDWLKERLKAIGINPKNAVVDVTNYILHELGQPLHAFDLDKIDGGEINVRWAEEQENFTTLEGEKLVLNKHCLVIAGGKKPAALAGIIGGAECGISDNTKHILLESAYFSPPAINVTARKFNLHTDASYRFERGCDIEMTKLASDRATELILEICGGSTYATESCDIYPDIFQTCPVKCGPNFINNLLGTKIPKENIASILKGIDPKLETDGCQWIFHTQSHRHDLKTKWDLAEEVARFYGYETIPSKVLPVTIPFTEGNVIETIVSDLENKLTGLGFYEIKNFDFLSAKDLTSFGFDLKNALKLKNPISADLNYMRPSLIPCISKSVLSNENLSNTNRWFFETGKIYFPSKDKPAEEIHCAGILCGKMPTENFWKKSEIKNTDFYHLKGAVSALFDGFEISFDSLKKTPVFLHPNLCSSIIYRGKSIGLLGKLHPKTAENLDLKAKDLWIFDFSISALGTNPAVKIRSVSDYPSAWRDLSLVADKSINYETILNTILKTNDKRLTNVELIDIYEGKNLPSGIKSMTFRLTFSDMTKTLIDGEVDGCVNNIINALKTKLKISLRA